MGPLPCARAFPVVPPRQQRCLRRSFTRSTCHCRALAAAAFAYLGVWNIASTYAAVLIPSGQAAVLGFTMPLWAAIGGHFVLGQRLDGRSLLALATGSRQWFMPSWTSLAVIGYISLVPMAVGNAAWFTIVRKVPAHVAALSPVLVPVVAMVTGAVVDGDPLGPYELLAMLLCISGVALNLRPRPL